MLKFLVLATDIVRRKGGPRKSPLFQFLRVFFAPGEVNTLTPGELDPRRPLTTEILLIENPTSLTPEQLRGVNYRQAVLFDYGDGRTPHWNPENKEFLSSLSDLYLKSFVDRGTDYDFRMGTLPLYRKKKLQQCLRIQELKQAIFGAGSQRKIDLFFSGAPTDLRIHEHGQDRLYNQRIEWLSEARTADFPYRFVGGLSYINKSRLKKALELHGDFRHLISRRRYDFYSYYYHLCHSKIALVPTGHARWTYRHYEAVYARNVMLSTDMTNIELLVPLPPHFIQVPDGAKILPYVEEGLKFFAEQSDLLDDNLRSLKQYYDQGQFSSSCPKSLERFLIQLEPGYQAQSTSPANSPASNR
ncbi:MAG: hypothetical protein HUJ26_06200 [Planctomycetaceae bacterium]|nr:hypothetical protein [Planctomycetaceae bacterium]